MNAAADSDLSSLTLQTPIGPLRLVTNGRGLLRVLFPSESLAEDPGVRSSHPREIATQAAARRHLAETARQLKEYFHGRRKEFQLPLDMRGSEHQIRVWRALLRIPYGQTLTYGELARRLGNPRSARAVGRGCATNPLPIIVPCHRVLSGSGSLQGFGGGIWRKRALLELEQGQDLSLPFSPAGADARTMPSR